VVEAINPAGFLSLTTIMVLGMEYGHNQNIMTITTILLLPVMIEFLTGF
jgi:hypothetical protein